MQPQPRLTEAELDAAIRANRELAERLERSAPWAGCTGHCGQGRNDCVCDAALTLGMWEPERRSPWLIALYAATCVLAVAASAAWPWGWSIAP